MLLVLMAMLTALVGVGMTSPVESAFSIAVHPVFFRVEASPRGGARALALDVDIKYGSHHLRLGWPGFLLAEASTERPARSL
jgi:hypothetical protein